ncbi:MAG: hypothetical protein AAGC57_15890 [Pseudomonadota bacterium]
MVVRVPRGFAKDLGEMIIASDEVKRGALAAYDPLEIDALSLSQETKAA